VARASLIKRAYRGLPQSFRDFPVVKRVKTWAQSHLLPHNWVYDMEYSSRTVEAPACRAAPIMADTIVRDLRPKRAVDVGCGTGALLEALRDRGCEVLGLEKSTAALECCRARGLTVREFDLEQDALAGIPDTDFDAVISMEVAEHLPQSADERYIDLLTSPNRGPVIVFTAAPPGQGGMDRINEQPPEYWFDKFARRGFHYNPQLSEQWQREWEDSRQVESW
jgi:SAM-dependent methyltransferase